MAALDAAAGKTGVITGKTYLGTIAVLEIDAGFDTDLLVDVISKKHTLIDGFDLCNYFLAGADSTDEETVIGETGRGRSDKGFTDHTGKVTEQLVAELETVPLVIQLEIRDVKIDEGDFLPP